MLYSAYFKYTITKYSIFFCQYQAHVLQNYMVDLMRPVTFRNL